MGTTLHTLAPTPGSTKTKKRLGRGRGSGTGKTSGKGVKGQKARAAHHGARLAFEGGQVPMTRRVPKRGFKNPNRIQAFPINVAILETLFDAGAVVDLETLRAKGIVPKLVDHIKVLGEGNLTKKLSIKAHGASAVAKEKIEKAGGTFELVPSRRNPAEAKA